MSDQFKEIFFKLSIFPDKLPANKFKDNVLKIHILSFLKIYCNEKTVNKNFVELTKISIGQQNLFIQIPTKLFLCPNKNSFLTVR